MMLPVSVANASLKMELPLEKRLSIRLLGEFSLIYSGEPVTSLNAERLQSLLVYLLLHRHAPQSRQQIAFLLWPESGDAQARSNLRNLLFSLRQALPDAEQFLEITNLTLRWKPEAAFTLDVADFEANLERAAEAEQINALAEEQQALEAAIELYGGELLPGNYDDWLLPLREELRLHYQEALENLISLLERRNDARSALRYAQRMLQQDPLDESTYVHLMRLYARVGDRAAVRRTYENCVSMLARELDVPPSESTKSAYARYLQMAVPSNAVMPELPARETLPPVTIPARTITPLPIPTVTFVGREVELAELAQLLADPGCRILTITGPGGIGKTHLALQSARGHQPVFAAGAAFVPLVAVTDAAQFVAALAAALGLSFFGKASPWEQLLCFLEGKELLLVLDNFEHLLSTRIADETTEQLLAYLSELFVRCPQVKILITSRERLNLQEEWVYDLHGLPLPAQDQSDWQENSSVALFLQMARKAQSNFSVNETNRSAIINICRMVGGMPLAIQLAAAWVRILSTDEIVSEIERNLNFLAVAHRNVPERHRSIQAVFDHSWQLLSPEEQRTFSLLSVFRGDFGREAAETITGASLRVFTSLLDKSLVRQNRAGRYSLHELLRHFAAQKLAEFTNTEDIAARHAHFYMNFLYSKLHLLEGPEQIAALDAIATEIENIQFAWRWAAEHDDKTLLLGLRAFFSFCYRRARFQEGAQAFAYAIDRQWGRTGEESSLPLLARLLVRHGMLVHALGQHDEARASLEVGVQFLRKAGNSPELALGLIGLGRLLDAMGEGLRTEELMLEALRMCREHGYTLGTAFALNSLGHHAWRRGRFDKAKRYIEEGVAIYRQKGDLWGLAYALNNLGNAAQNPSEYRRSIVLYEESRLLYERLGNMAGAALALNNLGFTHMMLGDYAAAGHYYEQSLALQRQLGGTLAIARTLNNQGHAAYLLGQYEEARRLSEESLALRRAANAPLDAGFSLYTLGLIVCETGAWEQAEQYWLDALAVFERFGYQQEMAGCLAELAMAALQRSTWPEAQCWLDRSLAICQTAGADASHARTLMVAGLLAHHQGHTDAATERLLAAFNMAIATHERILALDILIELVELSAERMSLALQVDALCLLYHHCQSRHPVRARAQAHLVKLGSDPATTICAQAVEHDLDSSLAKLATLFAHELMPV